MNVTRALKVASPPAKPLMVYDGECNFCKFWIRRWEKSTGGRVEYIASQDPRVGKQFPEIPRQCFEESVQFIETDGYVYSGAEAVFRSLGYSRWVGKPLWAYQKIPGFATVAEWLYRIVAQHRQAFSRLTRFFWGSLGALIF